MWRGNLLTPRYPKGKGEEGVKWNGVFAGMRKCVFLDSLEGCKENYVDLSDNWEGRVRAWHEGDCVYIGANGGIDAANACKRLFFKTGLEEIDFNGCFHTDDAKSMTSMFEECMVKKLDLSGFETGNVKDMSSMFENCYELEEVNVSGFDMFSVKNVNAMFAACYSLKKLDVSKWDVRRIKDADYMFFNCNELKRLDMSRWDFRNADSMAYMFFWCSGLKELNLTGFVTDEITDMYEMFSGLREDIRIIKTDACILKEGCELSETAQIISVPRREKEAKERKHAKYTSNVMKQRFDGMLLEEALELYEEKGIAASLLDDFKLRKEFYALIDGKEHDCWNWLIGDIVECRFVNHLFFCPKDAIDVSEKGDGSVKAWRIDDVLYIGAWGGVTSGKRSCMRLFEDCEYLRKVSFNGAFNTEDAEIMYNMFRGCKNLEKVDFENLEVKNAINISGMFEDCKNIKTLDLSGIVAGAEACKSDMFFDCESLRELDIRNMEFEDGDWIFLNMRDEMNVTVKDGVTRDMLTDLPEEAILFKG